MKKLIMVVMVILCSLTIKEILSNSVLTIVSLAIIVKFTKKHHIKNICKKFTNMIKQLFSKSKKLTIVVVSIMTILIIGRYFNCHVGLYTLSQRVDTYKDGIPTVYLVYKNRLTDKPICLESTVDYSRHIIAYVDKNKDSVKILVD